MADQPPHTCPGGCGRQVQYELLSCRDDWYRLPAPIRAALNYAAARSRVFPGAHQAAVAKAMDWYRRNPLDDGSEVAR